MFQRELLIKSTKDGSMQPSLFYKASEKNRPLLVGLHTWSYNRFNQIENMLPYAEKYNFNLLLPEFRGENLISNKNCTYACGSEYAKQDIKDAVDYVVANEDVDADNIFLLGLSGGGHMALLMSGFCGDYFKAVGAYVPITDLNAWAECNREQYIDHIMACCSSSKDEMRKRSPVTYAEEIAKHNVKIFHGKFDPVVPVDQSISLYNRIQEINPDSRVFLEIFDGEHEIDMEIAMYWLLSQYNGSGNIKITG